MPMANSRTIAGMQAFGKDVVVPKPDSGMVNVLVKVMINGEPTTLAASSPIQGFKFTVPAALLPESIVNTRSDSAQDARQGLVERAMQADGSPLPSWLSYDPETNTFSAKEIPAGAKPIEIKIQTVKDGQVLEESPPIVIDTK
jgi:mucin-19